MNKFLNLVIKNIQTSISVFAVIALALSNTYLIVQAQAIPEEAQQTLETNVESKNLTPQELIDLGVQGGSSSYPHLSCVQELVRTTQPSSVFVSDVPYNLQFHIGSLTNAFQDVNGDGLPDYVFAFNTVNGGQTLIQDYQACVYLNNGSGWTQAYRCYAVTHTNASTGQIEVANYYGDCAGEPSTKE